MTDDVNKIALIEKYLKGNLTGKNLSDFEAEISADPSLASDVAIQKEIYAGIEKSGDKQLLQELNQYHSEFELGTRPFSKRKKKAFFYTLGGFILILISVYTFTQMGPKNVKKEVIARIFLNDSIPEKRDGLIHAMDTTVTKLDSDTVKNQSNINTIISTNQPKIIEIKKFTNPIVLGKTTNKAEYIFTFGELKLFGVNDLDINRLELIRHNNEILLFDQKHYCVLEETHRRKPLVVDPSIKIFNSYKNPSSKSPKMKIVKSNLEIKEEIEFTSIRVIKKEGLKGRKYRYTGVTIEINEELYELLGDNFQLIHIDKMDHAIIKSNTGLFHLEKDTPHFVEIIKVHDPEIQYFFNTEERLVPLKSETVEGL